MLNCSLSRQRKTMNINSSILSLFVIDEDGGRSDTINFHNPAPAPAPKPPSPLPAPESQASSLPSIEELRKGYAYLRDVCKLVWEFKYLILALFILIVCCPHVLVPLAQLWFWALRYIVSEYFKFLYDLTRAVGNGIRSIANKVRKIQARGSLMNNTFNLEIDTNALAFQTRWRTTKASILTSPPSEP